MSFPERLREQQACHIFGKEGSDTSLKWDIVIPASSARSLTKELLDPAEVWQEPRLLVYDMVAMTTHTMSQQCLLTQALPTARPSRRVRLPRTAFHGWSQVPCLTDIATLQVVAAPRKAVELKDPPYALVQTVPGHLLQQG